MKVCFVRHSIRNRGSDRSSLGYADFLIAQGHEVVYYTHVIATDFSYSPRIQMRKIPWPWPVGTMAFMIVKAFAEDVVLVDLVIMALCANVHNRKKVIYLARDYDESYYRSLVLRILTRLAYYGALTILKVPVISCSDDLSRRLGKFSSMRTITVDNGEDMSFFSRGAYSALVSRKDIPPETALIVLFVRFDQRKGLDLALKALADLRARLVRRPWMVWTIGEALPGDPRFPTRHFGFLGRAELRDLLSEADIFLMASRSEGASTLLLQAMGCSCAVVATRAAHIITSGADGLLCEVDDWKGLADHLQSLIEDQAWCETLKKKSRVTAEKYGWQASCDGFLAAIRQLGFGERWLQGGDILLSKQNVYR